MHRGIVVVSGFREFVHDVTELGLCFIRPKFGTIGMKSTITLFLRAALCNIPKVAHSAWLLKSKAAVLVARSRKSL